jgi:hypothetical protein
VSALDGRRTRTCPQRICLLKGKLWTGFCAVFIPTVGVIGAMRLARPGSPWAHRRCADKPMKIERAQHREDRVNATWRAWREAFFDLIAGLADHEVAPDAARD